MLRNSLYEKKLYMLITVIAIMFAFIMTGCENSGSTGVLKETKLSDNKVSPSPKTKIKKKAVQKLESSLIENADKIIKDRAERIRDSVQELDKNEDEIYYYSYMDGNINFSIETFGFDDDNHGKYQFLQTEQKNGQVYIAVLHRTEDEKIYGEIYKYLG